jgi:hydroxymethylbilane synthase
VTGASHKTLRIATRKSPLAVAQAEWVAGELRRLTPGLTVELVRLETQGDVKLDGPLYESGGKGLFVKEIQAALLSGAADLAVHSAKDYPQENPAELAIAAIPKRADRRDLLLSNSGWTIETLPQGAKIGGSSLRRQGQLLALRPDLIFANLRGNVGTRLKKLAAGEYDAIILAAAGLERLGEIEWLAAGKTLPIIASSGQGALIVECRAVDGELAKSLRKILHDECTGAAVIAERAFVYALGGDCATPIGAEAEFSGVPMRAKRFAGLLVSGDGKKVAKVEATSEELNQVAEKLGEVLGRRLIALADTKEVLAAKPH